MATPRLAHAELSRPAPPGLASDSPIRQLIAGMMVSVGGRENPDLSQRTILLLLMLAVGGGPDTVTEMAALLQLPKSAVTRSMDRLVEYGWARRAMHPSDMRVVKLRISPAGMKHARRIEAAMRADARRR